MYPNEARFPLFDEKTMVPIYTILTSIKIQEHIRITYSRAEKDCLTWFYKLRHGKERTSTISRTNKLLMHTQTQKTKFDPECNSFNEEIEYGKLIKSRIMTLSEGFRAI